MTVSEIVNVLKDAKQVNLSWNGTLHEMVLEDPFMANAFADNIILKKLKNLLTFCTDNNIILSVQKVR